MFRKLKFLWRSFKSRYCDHKIEIEMLLESIKPGDIAIDVGANKEVLLIRLQWLSVKRVDFLLSNLKWR